MAKSLAWWLRLVVYTITAALSAVSIGFTVNALVKANRDVSRATTLTLTTAPPGTSISTSFQNLKITGAFLLAGEGLLGLTSLLGILNLLFSISNSKFTHLATISLWSFGFLWTLGSAIANFLIARKGSVTVAAFFLGFIKIPDEIVRGFENTIGYDPHYWPRIYVRIYSILPWALLIFAAIALVLAIIQLLPAKVKGVERPAAAAEANESPEASPVTEKPPLEDKRNPRQR
ncbi:hypothetical protein BS47DRAFT_7540 [Hydnum rufescens UP504]|uniref:Transmembrane protein n=1 Tax=Hydnum rufescens UP504 TaxID=1448309 RepID=A0A9P6BB24_9AGAM|nr:hypothetical protein BS47DRAFT_7540 [Hydnum rufescens UP504]